MRVGLVCPYSLDVPGGVQNHVQDLATVLIARGHQVALLAPGGATGSLPPHIETVGRAVPIGFNGAVGRVAFGPRVSAQTRRWLRDGDFDVVHVHEPGAPSVSLLALWASEAAVVATFHLATGRSRAISAAGAVLRPSFEKISARIAVSETARSTLVNHIGGEPVVIPNGIFCARFRAAKPRPEWASPGPTLVFLGRTDEPRKGLTLLLAAFADLLVTHPTARLLIAGQGDAAPVRQGPASLRRNVEFLGLLTDDDRSRLLASATVYVAPQLGGESFGVVLAEAMAAGAAVVASDLPAFRAVLDDGRLGELFAVGDPAAAARSIRRLLDAGPYRERLRLDAVEAVWR
ncbi:MAG: glycosyltransferase family 4 protein [Propionibacteriales bacterium]|nr:glycosyltransferase family 4 protein [Propionibacteriales bacterium]